MWSMLSGVKFQRQRTECKESIRTCPLHSLHCSSCAPFETGCYGQIVWYLRIMDTCLASVNIDRCIRKGCPGIPRICRDSTFQATQRTQSRYYVRNHTPNKTIKTGSYVIPQSDLYIQHVGASTAVHTSRSEPSIAQETDAVSQVPASHRLHGYRKNV